MDVSDFDFELAEDLIAQAPPVERGNSRLLVLDRAAETTRRTVVADLPRHLRRGDLLVVNDTRVFPARLLGRRDPSGGAVECLLLQRLEGGEARDEGAQGPAFARCASAGQAGSEEQRGAGQGPGAQEQRGTGDEALWDALVHPGQKLRPGRRFIFDDGEVRLHGEVLGMHTFGRRTIRLWTEGDVTVDAAIDRLGHIPLPPYIRRPDTPADRERYQTVFARARGSVAAPTAGLHFDDSLLETLARVGVERVAITLHVGYGTFKPVRAERVEDHSVDPEQYEISPAAAARITAALDERRRIVAVGTTTVRALETAAIAGDGRVRPGRDVSRVFIYPGFRFQVVGAMLTNFHLPKSSLLMLVSAFAGRERVLAAYREAIEHRFRFYSYGDAMLIV